MQDGYNNKVCFGLLARSRRCSRWVSVGYLLFKSDKRALYCIWRSSLEQRSIWPYVYHNSLEELCSYILQCTGMSGWLGTIALDTSLSHKCPHSLVPRLLPSVGRRLLFDACSVYIYWLYCFSVNFPFVSFADVVSIAKILVCGSGSSIMSTVCLSI